MAVSDAAFPWRSQAARPASVARYVTGAGSVTTRYSSPSSPTTKLSGDSAMPSSSGSTASPSQARASASASSRMSWAVSKTLPVSGQAASTAAMTVSAVSPAPAACTTARARNCWPGSPARSLSIFSSGERATGSGTTDLSASGMGAMYSALNCSSASGASKLSSARGSKSSSMVNTFISVMGVPFGKAGWKNYRVARPPTRVVTVGASGTGLASVR